MKGQGKLKMSEVGKFFKDAFSDMKESAKAQHKVDKMNYAAAKAEAKANFEEAKATSSPSARKVVEQKKRDEQIADAMARIEAANTRIEATKKD